MSEQSAPIYIFVGERRSPTAIARSWTWKDGHLCAATLFGALRACQLDPLVDACYPNLWKDDGEPDDPNRTWLTTDRRLWQILVGRPLVVVGLGKKVQAELRRLGVPHLEMRHPAGRGAGRKRAEYIAHVADVLARRAVAA